MKIKTKKNNHKIIIVAVIFLVVIIGLVLFFILNGNKKDNQSSEDNNIAAQQSESDKEMLDDINEDEENKNRAPNTDHQPPIITDKETGLKKVSMVSSYNIDSGFIYLRGGINNIVTGGECKAVLVGPGNKIIEKSTDLLYNASTVDCKTIEINRAELSPGSWKYKLQYTSSDTEGESDEITFEIK